VPGSRLRQAGSQCGPRQPIPSRRSQYLRLCDNSVVDHAVGGRVATSSGLLVVSLRLASNRKPFRLDSITHRGPRLVDPATPFQQGRRNDPDRNFGVDSSTSGRGRQLPGPIPVPHPWCFSAIDRDGKGSPAHHVAVPHDAGRLSVGGSVTERAPHDGRARPNGLHHDEIKGGSRLGLLAPRSAVRRPSTSTISSVRQSFGLPPHDSQADKSASRNLMMRRSH